MSDWKQLPGDYIRPPERLTDGRLRVVVERSFSGSDDIANTYLPACGSAIWNYAALTGSRTDYATLVLISAESATGSGKDNRSQPVVALVFETLPSTPTEFGLPVARALTGHYKNIVCAGSISSGTAILDLTTGTTAGMKAGLSVVIVGVAGTKIISTVNSSTQITLTTNAGATVTAAVVTVYQAIPAYEYFHRYIVAGDGTAPAFRIALNAAYYNALPAGGAQRYFCGQTVQTAEDGGAARAIITRQYCEQPDDYSYTQNISFNRPGTLNANGYNELRPPTVITTTATINISYSLGRVAPTALGYRPTRWARIAAEGLVAGDYVTSIRYLEREGYLADGYSLTAYDSGAAGNYTYEGVNYDISTIFTATATSTPSTTPTGTQVIRSECDADPVRGDIWRKVNTSVDFSSL
jgi:hypothetical protein